jgi:hypothetical protein
MNDPPSISGSGTSFGHRVGEGHPPHLRRPLERRRFCREGRAASTAAGAGRGGGVRERQCAARSGGAAAGVPGARAAGAAGADSARRAAADSCGQAAVPGDGDRRFAGRGWWGVSGGGWRVGGWRSGRDSRERVALRAGLPRVAARARRPSPRPERSGGREWIGPRATPTVRQGKPPGARGPSFLRRGGQPSRLRSERQRAAERANRPQGHRERSERATPRVDRRASAGR